LESHINMSKDDLNRFWPNDHACMKKIAVLLFVLQLISCASPRPPVIYVTIADNYFQIDDIVLKTSTELTVALKNRRPGLVELRNVGKPSYRQVEQAVQAISDAGGHLNMIGNVGE
jgi:hypothetical protein